MPDLLAPENAFLLGYLTKPHGIKGELRAHLEVQDLEPYLSIDSVYIERQDHAGAGVLTPVTVERIRPEGGDTEVLLQLAGVKDRNQAEQLAGLALYLPDSLLPPLAPGQFYYHQIIGYTVVDAVDGNIGTIEDIYESTGNDLVQVRHPEGQEVLVPLVDGIVGAADHDACVLHVTLPEGLLALYLNEPPPADDADPLDELLPPGARRVW